MFTLQAYIRVTSDAFIEVVIYCKHILQILYNKCLMFVDFKYNACMNHVKKQIYLTIIYQLQIRWQAQTMLFVRCI